MRPSIKVKGPLFPGETYRLAAGNFPRRGARIIKGEGLTDRTEVGKAMAKKVISAQTSLRMGVKSVGSRRESCKNVSRVDRSPRTARRFFAIGPSRQAQLRIRDAWP
jgi:hypothetical protein